jgi:Dolichyl-phosphate-mannose-protein mannosyltransferase
MESKMDKSTGSCDLAPPRAQKTPSRHSVIQTFRKTAAPLAGMPASGILVFAAVLTALPGLNAAFSSDEVWSLHAVGGSQARMLAILRADIHPPLYYELLFVWTRIFGSSELAVRALSLSFLLLGVWALYRWASRILGPQAGVIAASIYFTSPLAIMASRLGRMYTLLSLVSILSTYLYWTVFVEGQRSWRNWVPLVLVNALGSFTHIWFFFLLFAESLHLLIFVRQRWLMFALTMGGSLVPYAIFWFPNLLRQLRKSQEALAWMTAPGFKDVADTFILYTAPLLLLAPFLVWAAVRQRHRPPRWTGGIAFMLAAALAVPFAISFVKPVFYPRFTVIGLHLFAVAVAACAPRLRTWQLPVLLSIFAGAISVSYAAHTKCDARWGAEFLARQAVPGDTAIFSSLSRLPVDHYLARSRMAAGVSETSFPAEIDSHPGYEGNLTDPARMRKLEAEADALVARLRNRHGAIYFFHGFRPEVDGILQRRLETAFHPVQQHSVNCDGMGCYYNAVTVYQ